MKKFRELLMKLINRFDPIRYNVKFNNESDTLSITCHNRHGDIIDAGTLCLCRDSLYSPITNIRNFIIDPFEGLTFKNVALKPKYSGTNILKSDFFRSMVVWVNGNTGDIVHIRDMGALAQAMVSMFVRVFRDQLVLNCVEPTDDRIGLITEIANDIQFYFMEQPKSVDTFVEFFREYGISIKYHKAIESYTLNLNPKRTGLLNVGYTLGEAEIHNRILDKKRVVSIDAAFELPMPCMLFLAMINLSGVYEIKGESKAHEDRPSGKI